MQNRFIVKSKDLPINHLQNPGKIVWIVYDRKLSREKLSYYTTEAAAQGICDRKNGDK